MKFTRNRQTVVVLFAGILMALGALSQTAYAQGESAVPFLLIAPNARADGMGEAGVGLADDASAAFWNPAGLAFQTGQEASITHSNWLPQFQQADLFYDYMAYRNYIESLGGTISGSVTYLNLGTFQITTDSPTPIGEFKGYEFAVTGGYATKVNNNLGLGFNVRYIRSVLSPVKTLGAAGSGDRLGIGSSVSFDVATLWKATDNLNIGVNLSNLGPKIAYINQDQADPLPTMLRLGFAYKLLQTEYNSVSLIADFSRMLVRRYAGTTKLDSSGNLVTDVPGSVDALPKSLFTAWGDRGFKKVDVAGGVEYWYGQPKLMALRFGYFYESPEAGNRQFMTFGAGIRYDVYGFDFSYLSAIEENSPLAETLRFTLLINWGGAQAE